MKNLFYVYCTWIDSVHGRVGRVVRVSKKLGRKKALEAANYATNCGIRNCRIIDDTYFDWSAQ